MATLVDTAGLITQLWPDRETAPSPMTIARLRKQGKIPYVRLNHLIYYDTDAVRRAITERMTFQCAEQKVGKP
jgi:hypothetical protein